VWIGLRIEIEPQLHSHSFPQVAYQEVVRLSPAFMHSRGFRGSAKWLRNEKRHGHDLRIECVVSMILWTAQDGRIYSVVGGDCSEADLLALFLQALQSGQMDLSQFGIDPSKCETPHLSKL
jgi:hypothetical protein